MPKLQTTRLVLGSLMLAAMAMPANSFAMSDAQIIKGFSDCIGWCNDHNKTEASRRACDHQCIQYWYFTVKQPPSREAN